MLPDTGTRSGSEPADRLLRLLPWLALAAALLPLAWNGFPRGHDWQYELTRIAEYRYAAAAGQVPPFWAPNLYGGYGSPAFLFYAPLYVAVASLLSLVTGNFTTAATLALLVFGALGVWTLQALVRAVPGAPRGATRVAIYLYLLSPYLIANALLRNANAEFAALCLLPLPFAGLLRLGRDTRRGVATIAIGLALVILAHNLTALVAVAGMLFLGLVLFLPSRRWRDLLALGVGVAWGLLTSAFFWLPALLLKPRIRTEDLLSGKFDFHRQFPALDELFAYREVYALGVLPLVVLVAAIAVFWRAAGDDAEAVVERRRLAWGALAAASLCLFLQTPWSTPLWEHLPWLAFFQFPWRFSGPLALALAVAAGLAFAERCRRASAARRRGVELVLFALALVNAVPHLLAVQPLAPELRERFEASLAPERIRHGRHRVTVGDEYLPRDADLTLYIRRPAADGPIVGTEKGVRTTVLRDLGHHLEWTSEAAAPARLLVGRWYFPGWRLWLDGEAREVRRHPTGAIEVALPAGRHHLELRLVPPGGRSQAWIGSLVGLVLVGFLWVRSAPVRARDESADDEESHG